MNKTLLYIIILLVFIPTGTAKNIIVHDNIIANSSALGGGNITNNYYTSSVNASTCNPANEASYYNGTGFQCVSISDNDPFILLTSEGSLNVNSANYWAGLTTPSPDWNSNKSVPWANLTGVPIEFPNSSIPGKLDVSTYSGNFPNSTLTGLGGNYPNSTLASYNSNFPNNTLNSYGGSFPNNTFINYLLIATYGTNFPNTTLNNYGGDFPNNSYKANDTVTLTSAYGNDTTTLNSANTASKNNDTVTLTSANTNIANTNTSMLNYVNTQDNLRLLISTYLSDFPNTTLNNLQNNWNKANWTVPYSNITGDKTNYSIPAANITGLGTSFAQYNHTRNNVTAASTTTYNLSMSLTLTKGMMEIIECDLLTNASLTAIAPQMWYNISGADAQTISIESYNSSTVQFLNSSSAATTNVLIQTSAGTIITPVHVQAHSNQTANGAFTISMKASGTGTVQLDRGSYCRSVEQ